MRDSHSQKERNVIKMAKTKETFNVRGVELTAHEKNIKKVLTFKIIFDIILL